MLGVQWAKSKDGVHTYTVSIMFDHQRRWTIPLGAVADGTIRWEIRFALLASDGDYGYTHAYICVRQRVWKRVCVDV